MMASSQGLRIRDISRQEFKTFVALHGMSEEIGRIGSGIDHVAADEDARGISLVGLTGCGSLHAVASCMIVSGASEESQVGKLDSVVVGRGLRRRGLANVLVSYVLERLVADARYNVTTILSHAVHPATVRLLRWLFFSEPQLTGAPLVSVNLEAIGRERFLAACSQASAARVRDLKLQCIVCARGCSPASRWCRSG